MIRRILRRLFSALIFAVLPAVMAITVCAADAEDISGFLYTLDTDGPDSEGKYLIASGKDGVVSVLTNDIGRPDGMDVTSANGTIVVSDDARIGWTITPRTAGSKIITVKNGETFLDPSISALFSDSAAQLNFHSLGKGGYEIKSPNHWLRYNKSWGRSTKNASVCLYALTAAARADTVVLDYGLPVDIPVLANDTSGGVCALAGIGLVEDIPAGGFSDTLNANFSNPSLTLDHGLAALNGDMIHYTPDERFLHLSGSESLAYALSCPGGYLYTTVTVFPAPCVYYEDDFLSFSTYTRDGVKHADDWTLAGTPLSRAQGTDSGPYGYDPAYLDMTGFSMGAARTVHLSADHYAEAAFSFTGTGFELMTTTGKTTGAVLAEIYRAGELVKSILVDSFYSGSGPETLYQVPLIRATNLGFGRYDVRITADCSSAFDHGQYQDGSCDICIDALRVYGQGQSPAALAAHLADAEGWPRYVDLRAILLNGGSAEGGLFVDGSESASLTEYAAHGPKNEVYLASGQVIVFNLGLDAGSFSSVRLGLRSLSGSTVCRIFSTGGTVEETICLNTAAAMSYDITALAGGTMVVTNIGEGILSLTDIRLTYPTDPNQI